MRRKKKEFKLDDEMDITPMIDVTFLLLIFFMVTSKMNQVKGDLPPAKNGLGVNAKDAIVISVFNMDPDPEVYITMHKRVLGVAATAEEGPLALEQLTELVREEMAGNRRTVIIRADRDLASGFVEEVARAASEADPNLGTEEGLQFFVGVMDKPR
ncbi:MAG: biopolymer transporter ExbD [Planctomycetaceae bacterium]|nr:biopolymer transporter ExbD [Planctomycetaceae bacterium]MCA9042711.1 biopolymer transporter ExbD [Planctomycetaceae bacterium]MCB9951912.1 biopolymer transporter ExbD [Planctomycetaceae bacterium]